MGLNKPLIKRYRGTWVAASAVNDAVSQAIAYLVGLDENRLHPNKVMITRDDNPPVLTSACQYH
jgi:hypothetical protein